MTTVGEVEDVPAGFGGSKDAICWATLTELVVPVATWPTVVLAVAVEKEPPVVGSKTSEGVCVVAVTVCVVAVVVVGEMVVVVAAGVVAAAVGVAAVGVAAVTGVVAVGVAAGVVVATVAGVAVVAGVVAVVAGVVAAIAGVAVVVGVDVAGGAKLAPATVPSVFVAVNGRLGTELAVEPPVVVVEDAAAPALPLKSVKTGPLTASPLMLLLTPNWAGETPL